MNQKISKEVETDISPESVAENFQRDYGWNLAENHGQIQRQNAIT